MWITYAYLIISVILRSIIEKKNIVGLLVGYIVNEVTWLP